MDQSVIQATELAGSVDALNFSMWSLFMQATWIVKIVLIVLLLASVWSWAIIFEKLWRLHHLQRAATGFEDEFWSGGSLDKLYEKVSQRPENPMTAIFVAAMREWRRSSGRGLQRSELSHASLQQRTERIMHVTLGREMERLERNMTFLASVGSTAPFVGLFGTVYGIMNSFQSIALTKQTSLAVVAPGIAEALFATALGLVAAIPAVIAYNKISNDLGRYASRLEAFAHEFTAIFSRQLEEAE
ncbi:MAG: Biopolymer transport protein ExbB [Alphaproteobacteria bacterium MarineAlpha10_Bin3]|jgi:biopolymer transport protein TolQ|nr:MAG: Biopolymer transport protein ExbB [Alphaproteobacteria bacterium MarineAlpha10_Bin3]PPR71278.1 MAG: Biopolymer transport protein ExbB [Alphaproteobacteria bacterium MarineAlpha4_Bin1]